MLLVLASLHFFNYWYFITNKVSMDSSLSSGRGVVESKDLHQKRATAYVIGLLLDQGKLFILSKTAR